MITAELLKTSGNIDVPDVDVWVNALNAAADKYDINTSLRVAAFIAQCAHESSGFKTVIENLNYSAAGLRAVFPTHFAAGEEDAYARHPERIANRVYANRMGNGDENSGDGWKYRGRGAIQVTGRGNYRLFGAGIGFDTLLAPETLETPHYAVISAGWFWSSHSLNSYADARDFLGITKRINGGVNGLADRQQRYNRLLAYLDGGQ
jgi:putative chitinase